MTRLTPVLVLLVSTSLVRAGFRCTLGNWACSASCVTLGQTSGICDGEGECNCSERSIRSVDVVDVVSLPQPQTGPIPS